MRGKLHFNRRKCRFTSRQRDAACAVHAGNDHRVFNTRVPQDFGHGQSARANRSHFSTAPGSALKLATVIDNKHRLFQRQCTGRPCGGNLANTVTRDDAGRQAVRAQGFGDANLIRKQRRLRNFGERVLRRADRTGKNAFN